MAPTDGIHYEVFNPRYMRTTGTAGRPHEHHLVSRAQIIAEERFTAEPGLFDYFSGTFVGRPNTDHWLPNA